jgi:hypothetical protein
MTHRLYYNFPFKVWHVFVRGITCGLTVSPIRLLNFTAVATQEDDELEGMYDPKGCGIIAFEVFG